MSAYRIRLCVYVCELQDPVIDLATGPCIISNLNLMSLVNVMLNNTIKLDFYSLSTQRYNICIYNYVKKDVVR